MEPTFKQLVHANYTPFEQRALVEMAYAEMLKWYGDEFRDAWASVSFAEEYEWDQFAREVERVP